MNESFDATQAQELEARLFEAERGGESEALRRVLARVRAHAAASRPAERHWRGRLFAFAAIAVPAAAAAAVGAVILLGHDHPVARVVVPAGTPTAAPSASISPSPATGPMLLETSTPPQANGPVTVHWITLAGTEVASAQLPANEAVLGTGGGHVLVYRSDGHVLDLSRDGTAADVGRGMPADSSPGQASVPVHALVSPDGTQWIWGQLVSQSGATATSRLMLGGIGTAPRVVLEATESGRGLEPFRWTLANPLISHAALGIGGYLLFNYTSGPAYSLDLGSGHETPVGSPTADVVDAAGNGAVAYIDTPPNGPNTGVVNGPGARGLGFNVTAQGAGQSGAVMFDPTSSHLVYATSPAVGPSPGEHFTTHIVDLNTGSNATFGPPDLHPEAWTADGRLVEVRGTIVAGQPGTYLVALDGSTVRISAYTEFAGLVTH